MACAWLAAAYGEPRRLPKLLAADVGEPRWRQVSSLVLSGVASPTTTSMGRLFDAVAALCGVRAEVSYEGQAAIELEAACDPDEDSSYPCDELDVRAAVRALCDDLDAGRGVPVVAARFHNTVADATARALLGAALSHDVATVVLSGGVFQNRRLLERTMRSLAGSGLRVLTPERLPPNDGGIAYGQAAIAAAGG